MPLFQNNRKQTTRRLLLIYNQRFLVNVWAENKTLVSCQTFPLFSLDYLQPNAINKCCEMIKNMYILDWKLC